MFRLSLLSLTLCTLVLVLPARANPTITVDLNSGTVLNHDEAFRLWSPASITKIMTAYVAFRAIERGDATLQTPVTLSQWAADQPASKMYWKPGTTVSLGEAVVILMVKSGNDIATAVAETIGGTELEFVEMMNEEAARLGMDQTNFVNPHGLPDPGLRQVTTARDFAILTRAVRTEFAEYDDLFTAEAIDIGAGRPILSYNLMLGRFEGADGMKTGFICASGFNIVNTATRTLSNGEEHTIATVVLGATNQETRAVQAAELMQDGFSKLESGEAADLPTLETFEPYGDTTSRTDLRPVICTAEAAASRRDGRDEQNRMVLDTDLITPRDRDPVTVAIEPGPPLPYPKLKPAELGGPDPAPSMPQLPGSVTPMPSVKPIELAGSDPSSDSRPTATGDVASATGDSVVETSDEATNEAATVPKAANDNATATDGEAEADTAVGG